MMRRLLCGVAAGVLLFATCRPANALFGVGDIVFDPSSYAELVQQAKSGLEELKWLGDIYGDAEKQLNQLMQFYNLFAHITDATQLAQILNNDFIQSPLLTDALQLEQAFSGLGLHTTLAGKVSAVVNRLQYYRPATTDFTGFHLNHRITATAGQLSSAEDALASEALRITGLNDLKLGIATADPKRVQDIGARASIENATATAQTNKLLASQILQQAAKATAEQQRETAYRFSADTLRSQAESAAASANAGVVQLITP